MICDHFNRDSSRNRYGICCGVGCLRVNYRARLSGEGCSSGVEGTLSRSEHLRHGGGPGRVCKTFKVLTGSFFTATPSSPRGSSGMKTPETFKVVIRFRGISKQELCAQKATLFDPPTIFQG